MAAGQDRDRLYRGALDYADSFHVGYCSRFFECRRTDDRLQYRLRGLRRSLDRFFKRKTATVGAAQILARGFWFWIIPWPGFFRRAQRNQYPAATSDSFPAFFQYRCRTRPDQYYFGCVSHPVLYEIPSVAEP